MHPRCLGAPGVLVTAIGVMSLAPGPSTAQAHSSTDFAPVTESVTLQPRRFMNPPSGVGCTRWFGGRSRLGIRPSSLS